MPPIPWRISVQDHPGSTLDELINEPSWDAGHQHRIGYKNNQDRLPGLTHAYDESSEEDDETETAVDHFHDLEDSAKGGDLTNFRDLVNDQTVFVFSRMM